MPMYPSHSCSLFCLFLYESKRAVIASTHSRMFWWSCLEALALGLVSLWQISFLRRTLEVRRVL